MLDADIPNEREGNSVALGDMRIRSHGSWPICNYRTRASLLDSPLVCLFTYNFALDRSCRACAKVLLERVQTAGASLRNVVMRNTPGIFCLVVLALADSSRARYILGDRRLFAEGMRFMSEASSSCYIVRVRLCVIAILTAGTRAMVRLEKGHICSFTH